MISLAWDVPWGTFELKSGGRGTLENPCGDWADIQDSDFAMNLRCNIVMDDGSVIYLNIEESSDLINLVRITLRKAN